MYIDSELALLAIIAGLFVLIFATELKIELIAILVLLSLHFSGLISASQALSGFSSSVVMTLIGLFIITRALEETGVVQWIAARLNRWGQGSEVRLTILFMLVGALLSLIMNNVAAGAVLLPTAVHVSRSSDVRVSKLLMPMSFGTLVGGMATYLTTANILMSELLQSRGLDGLNMLDFMPMGGLIVAASLLYMLLIGRHMIPQRESRTHSLMQTLPKTYQLDERFWELVISPQSRIANKSLSDAKIGQELGLTVALIWRGRQAITTPTADTMLLVGDRLLVVGRQERVEQLEAWGNHLVEETEFGSNSRELLTNLTTEILVAPRSDAIGKTLTQLKFRDLYEGLVLALWRGSRSYRTDVGKKPLEIGDAMLMMGTPESIKALADSRDYIVPTTGYAALSFRPQKAPFAIIITAVVLSLAILDLVSLPMVMLAGAAGMVLTGCLSMEEFYEAVEWRVVFLVAGMLPLSIAIADTGLADRVGEAVVDLAAGSSPLILILGMVLLTMFVVQIIGGQISALLVGPIAINAALQMNVSPQAMSVAVAMSCSMAFLTPIAHPVNILMMGPGGYEFKDFFRVGLGMTIMTIITMMLGLVIFWGVY